MACGVHTCTNHNNKSTQCIGNRNSCSSNRALTWYPSTSIVVDSAQVEELRVKIRDEVSTWNIHRSWESPIISPTTIYSGNSITPSVYNDLNTMVGNIYGATATNEVTENIIGIDEWAYLVDRYNAIRTNCICNSDCSCNSICACYGDCDCNYSDERLKENIVFKRKIDELNVYHFNYKDDKQKVFEGVIAQELINSKYSDSVYKDYDGFYYVDYSKLPIQMKEVI